MSGLDRVLEELRELRQRVERLEDAILDGDDVEAIEEARRDLQEGKTISLEEAKKKLLQ